MVSAVDAATGRTLLQEAVARGFSAEGEIFTLSHLAALAMGRCGLAAEVVALRRYLTTVLPQHTRVERLRLVPWLLTQGVLGVPWVSFAPP